MAGHLNLLTPVLLWLLFTLPLGVGGSGQVFVQTALVEQEEHGA